MIVRFLLAALAAGLLAGVLVTPVQYLRVVPLIHAAEAYESAGGHRHDHASLLTSALMRSPRDGAAGTAGAGDAFEVLPAHGPDPMPAAAGAAGEPAGAISASRLLGTLLANLVTGAGFALLLAGASRVLDAPFTAANGLLWGLAGFAVAAVAPALGLPPELPAMPAGDLATRQGWWTATVALSALGAYAVVLRPELWIKALGALAIAAPHLWGAPRPLDLASPIPPTLAAEFAVASLATAAFFWLTLGAALGLALDRSGARPA